MKPSETVAFRKMCFGALWDHPLAHSVMELYSFIALSEFANNTKLFYSALDDIHTAVSALQAAQTKLRSIEGVMAPFPYKETERTASEAIARLSTYIEADFDGAILIKNKQRPIDGVLYFWVGYFALRYMGQKGQLRIASYRDSAGLYEGDFVRFVLPKLKQLRLISDRHEQACARKISRIINYLWPTRPRRRRRRAVRPTSGPIKAISTPRGT